MNRGGGGVRPAREEEGPPAELLLLPLEPPRLLLTRAAFMNGAQPWARAR